MSFPKLESSFSSAVAVSGLSKSYETQSGRLVAVEDFDIDIGRGDCYSIVGPSGCGKSTLLKIVAGLTPFDTGTVSVFGKAVATGRRDVGLMFQTPVLLPWRSVLQNVLLPFEIFGGVTAEARIRAAELLELVGLSEFVEKYPWELSGGMQQRVALCRVLAPDPDLLLMDEPLAALDEFTRERLIFEISSLHEKLAKTVIYVTHDIQEALILADTAVVMTSHPGRIAGIVDVELPRPRHPEMLGSPHFMDRVGKVRDLLRDAY